MEKQTTPHSFQLFLTKSILFFLFLFLVNIGFGQAINEKTIRDNTRKFLKNYAKDSIFKPFSSKTGRNIKIDTIIIDEINKKIGIHLSNNFCNIPFRYDNVELLYSELKKLMGDEFNGYTFTLYTLKQPIEQLIPNAYRNKTDDYDAKRLPAIADKKIGVQPPMVQNLSKPIKIQNGLINKYVALWHSHGWYYEQKLDRWEWQRARLFQTVEDKYTMSIILPYAVPMLENAGANVLLPRERDVQTEMIIVDNDVNSNSTQHQYKEETTAKETWKTAKELGFKPLDVIINNENPFKKGTFRVIKTSKTETATAQWFPKFNKSGSYAVYISYGEVKNAANEVQYTVYHAGGTTSFFVNQQKGAGTWIYLGTFQFNVLADAQHAQVVMNNKGAKGKFVSADGVRFGGGMGNVVRNGKLSERPRYLEGARYYMQFCGMPDSLIYNLNKDKSDYKDDYQCRGDWVNYLKGNPSGPTKNPKAAGLNIPVDVSLAVHTDAGISWNDTVIGTLAIYNSQYNGTVFPDGMSKLANRDLTDILQTQIVDDIRQKWDTTWTRRAIWDKDYSESWRPNVPSSLIELFSHQNLIDMKFGLDPRFRFDVGRSIYKGILKFIAAQNKQAYVVQPLPVTHFQAIFNVQNEVELRWRPQIDPQEKTAKADKYIVYTRMENGGFDNGFVVNEAFAKITNIEKGKIYSFRVAAANAGGESFPSEILSVCLMDTTKRPVLIVSGFQRVCAPEAFETKEYAGFADFLDHGVVDHQNLSFIGKQYEFSKNQEWMDDDAAGFGSSYGNDETKMQIGNSFNYPFVHGLAIKNAGLSFVSTSKAAVSDTLLDIQKYKIIDLILGEERETPAVRKGKPSQFKAFPNGLQINLAKYCNAGGNLFVSGAYVGRDLYEHKAKTSSDVAFAKNVLKIFWRTTHASRSGQVRSVSPLFTDKVPQNFWFNSEYNPENQLDSLNYQIEAPDGIEPADSTAKTMLRYSENNISSGVIYQGRYKVIAWGFPFETLVSADVRNKWMREILDFFDKKDN